MISARAFHFCRSENRVLVFEWLAQKEFINEIFESNAGLMPLGPILVECTALPIFFSMLLILALLISGALCESCFGPNAIILLAKETEVYLTIFE